MSLRIRLLQVHNFRAFRGTHKFEFEADPDRHLELITGPNGSGKSTIIEALQLCFFGDTARDGFHFYVNQQVVDNLEVDERATAEISVELYDEKEEQVIRVFRNISTLKTPQGKKDVVDEPEIEYRKEVGEWTKVSSPEEFLANLIPEAARPFSFYDPEVIHGLDTWEGGESFDELVSRVRDIRNQYTHSPEIAESTKPDIQAEYLAALTRILDIVDDSLKIDQAEEYLRVGPESDDGPLLSSGSQILVSFALITVAGELTEVDTPLIMDMPFARVGPEKFEAMSQILRQITERQIIIVGFSDRVDELAANLSSYVGSHHRLSVDESGVASNERVT